MHNGECAAAAARYRPLVNAAIAGLRKKYKQIVLSDEMWVVDTERSSWQEKIRRLGVLLADQDVKVAVVVREPIDIAYSLYVEMWPISSSLWRGLSEYLSESNQALLFDYGKLRKNLAAAFALENVKFFEFSRIVAPEGVRQFADTLAISLSDALTTGHENRKLHARTGYVPSPTTLRTAALRAPLVRQIIRRVPRRFYDRFARALERIPVTAGKPIEYPTEQVVDDFYSRIGSGLRDFENSVGIAFQWGRSREK